jgi:hypothetical protein
MQKEKKMPNFLFVLSKDDNEAATRCFQFAKIAHSKGHHVDMFFIDGGVAWADKNRDLSIKTATGDCPGDYLPDLVKTRSRPASAPPVRRTGTSTKPASTPTCSWTAAPTLSTWRQKPRCSISDNHDG